jgi:hypothetical protein
MQQEQAKSYVHAQTRAAQGFFVAAGDECDLSRNFLRTVQRCRAVGAIRAAKCHILAGLRFICGDLSQAESREVRV